jgi:hypothetical protein
MKEDDKATVKTPKASAVDPGVMYPLPQDAIDNVDDYKAALVARDEVLKSLFRFQYKKAVYYGRIAEQSRRLFWKKVRETYPELTDCELTYDYKKETLEVKKGA